MNIFDIPVHPAADVFPMLDADELAELAADIAENGLRSPLVVSGLNSDMQLIDGRNRRAACKLVGIEPQVQQLEGDAVSYILSSNIQRRHMTKGQRAMAVARIVPEATRIKRKGSGSTDSVDHGVSAQRISYARTVLKLAPDHADSVLSGATSLDAAYEIAQERKRAADSTESRLLRIRLRRADLADQIVEERLSIEAAETELREMDKREVERVNAVNIGLTALSDAADYLNDSIRAAKYKAFLNDEGDRVTAGGGAAALKAKLRGLARLLMEVTK